MKKPIIIFALACIAFAALPQAAFTQYKISRSVFGSGGIPVSDAGNRIESTAGQTAAGMASTAGVEGYFGFWYTTMPVRVDAGHVDQAPTSALLENYPNPFSGETVIRFTLSAAQNVTLTLYDLLGHEVRPLLEEPRPAGAHSVTFNTAGLAPGVYFYKIVAGTFSAARSLVILR